MEKKVKNNSKFNFIPFGHGRRTLEQRATDNLSNWAGSWKFLIGFGIFLLIWIGLNISMWVSKWDPYPFILLNLVLSCLAAIQAPIILMSQSRQEQKDRIHAEYDYLINKKSEKEIREIKRQLTRIESYIFKKNLK